MSRLRIPKGNTKWRHTLYPRIKMNTIKYDPLSIYSFATQAQEKKELEQEIIEDIDTKEGFWDKLIQKYGEHTIQADGNVNRWKFVPMAVSTHLCLGACYAWSIFNEPLTREIGVVTSATADWALSSCVGTFTGIVIAQGLAMAFFGKWVQRVGPRIAGTTGACLYGGGMMLGAFGVYMHSLPLLYLGYGAIAGTGMGLAYLPPLATLINWFPDRRGLASGMAICGFGGGAIGIVELKKKLLEKFYENPVYIGNISDVVTKRDTDGKLLALHNDKFVECVNVTGNELNILPNYISNNLTEGLYLVGTGNTGIATTMGILGTGYLAICLTSCMMLKTPPKGYNPGGNSNQKSDNAVVKYVHVDDVMKTPQFWLIWTTFLSTATAGMGILSCAKDVLVTCFATNPKAISMGLTAFAAGYVQLLAFGNLSGRFGWATVSDYMGRKNLFTMATATGAPLYYMLPIVVAAGVGSASVTPLIVFYGSTMVIISYFGCGYSCMPAYETDLFGSKHVTAIHGRIMTASALAGTIGPLIFSKIHANQERNAIIDLSKLCDNESFKNMFGVDIIDINKLIDAKQINIAKILELCPTNTIDPTPYLYDPAFKTMGVCLGVGCIANLLVKPVNTKYFRND